MKHFKILFIAFVSILTIQGCTDKTATADHNEPAKHTSTQENEKARDIASAQESEHNSHAKNEKHEVHEKADSGVPASKAMNILQAGNERYKSGNLIKEGQSQSDREKLIGGQKPHTIILSCSDSRVPPELIFDQKLGEIFVVRTAGEALDQSAIASIEYAVEHLGVHNLVVMAHESCGAVKAAFGTLNGEDAGSPSLNYLVKDIHPRILKFKGHEPTNALISEAKANASGVAKDLLGRSKIVNEKVESNELAINTAIYHLNSGWVEFYSAPTSAEGAPGLANSPTSEKSEKIASKTPPKKSNHKKHKSL